MVKNEKHRPFIIAGICASLLGIGCTGLVLIKDSTSSETMDGEYVTTIIWCGRIFATLGLLLVTISFFLRKSFTVITIMILGLSGLSLLFASTPMIHRRLPVWARDRTQLLERSYSQVISVNKAKEIAKNKANELDYDVSSMYVYTTKEGKFYRVHFGANRGTPKVYLTIVIDAVTGDVLEIVR